MRNNDTHADLDAGTGDAKNAEGDVMNTEQLEQLDAIIACVKALNEVMPRGKDDFLAWVQRGSAEGLITKDERDAIGKVFVYQPLLLIQHLSLVAA